MNNWLKALYILTALTDVMFIGHIIGSWTVGIPTQYVETVNITK